MARDVPSKAGAVGGPRVGGRAAARGDGAGALLEHLVYDESGHLLTTSLMDYFLPTVYDVPQIDVIRTETPTPLNALGVKGAGEGGTIAPAAAIAAAVEDAQAPLGVRMNRMPMSPESIVGAIGDRATRQEQAKTPPSTVRHGPAS